MINNIRIVISAGVNADNSSIKVGVMVDLFGILAHINANVINHVMLVNNLILQIAMQREID